VPFRIGGGTSQRLCGGRPKDILIAALKRRWFDRPGVEELITVWEECEIALISLTWQEDQSETSETWIKASSLSIE
jgi:hypothetical protein